MAVRVAKFPVYFGKPFPKELHRRWLALAERCGELRNLVWRTWLVWHTEQGSERRLRDWLEAVKAWYAAQNGPKPSCPVQCVPAELGRLIYARLRAVAPELHTRSLVLLQSALVRDMTKHRAARGSLSGWMAVLLNRQSAPSFLTRESIPFDAKNSDLAAPCAESDWWFRLRLRLQLLAPRKSEQDDVRLWVRWQRKPLLLRIAEGKLKFCGSNLVFNREENRWYVAICYDQPAGRTEADLERKAYVSAGRRCAWRLRLGGGTQRVGPPAAFIASRRQALLKQRLGRQNNYQWSASSTKGHGRNRAMQAVFALSRAWKDFCQTVNQTIAAELVRRCREAGVGTLIVRKPGDGRMLATAGRTAGYEKTSGWDWSRALAILNSACEKAGIAVEIREATAGPVRETTV